MQLNILELWLFANLGVLNLSARLLKQYLSYRPTRGLKLSQLIGDDECIT